MEFGQLSHHWNGSLEQIQGWFCSRKYNGWSTFWDGGITRGMLAEEVPWYYQGRDKQIMSTGLWSMGRTPKADEIRPKVIQAPKYFTNELPKNVPVHGELWFDDRLDIVKKTCGMKYGYNPMWYNIKFMAFNIKPYYLWEEIEQIPKYANILEKIDTNKPDTFMCIENITLKEAMGYLNQFSNETFNPVHMWHIKNEADLKQSQKIALKYMWEGLMFANPVGKYECKRSHNNLKWVEPYETEAAVYNYEDGKTGKNIGKVGAIKATLVWDEKVTSIRGGKESFIGREANFCISGLTDAERNDVKKIHPIGSKIKFSFKDISTHGIPQSCNIYRGE